MAQIKYCPNCGKEKIKYLRIVNFGGFFLKLFDCKDCLHFWYESPTKEEIEEYNG